MIHQWKRALLEADFCVEALNRREKSGAAPTGPAHLPFRQPPNREISERLP
jgi:hypothetical protein